MRTRDALNKVQDRLMADQEADTEAGPLKMKVIHELREYV